MIPLYGLGLFTDHGPYHSLLFLAAVLVAVCSLAATCVHWDEEVTADIGINSSPVPRAQRTRSLVEMWGSFGEGSVSRRFRRQPPKGKTRAREESRQRRRHRVMPLPAPFEPLESKPFESPTSAGNEAVSILEVIEERALIVLVLAITCCGWCVPMLALIRVVLQDSQGSA